MRPQNETPWHALDVVSTVERLATDRQRGLDVSALGELRMRYGPNELPTARQRPLWMVFLNQFRSPLIYLLFGAAAVALLLRETKDAIVIFIVVLLNALIGAYQEGRAEHALAALRGLASQKARVIRGGREDVIDARDLVPGDLLVLVAGDAVTADARVTDHASLRIAEAALTGESVPISKTTGVIAPESALADRTNMVYAGTHVTAGRARAIVVATGTATPRSTWNPPTMFASSPKPACSATTRRSLDPMTAIRAGGRSATQPRQRSSPSRGGVPRACHAARSRRSDRPAAQRGRYRSGDLPCGRDLRVAFGP